MNKPIVKVKEKIYSVVHISVVLKLNSGPLIYLRLSEKLDGSEYKFSNEETFKKEFVQDIYQEEECEFIWAEKTISFILVGYNSLDSKTFELVGLVVKKDFTKWWNQNNFQDKTQDYLIYQITKGKNCWPFFNKVLGDKFEQPNQDYVESLKLLFPDNACICRYRDATNFHFLNKSIAFASRYLPQLQGWCAFDSDKPLRLILFEERKKNQTIPKLDKTWNPCYRFLPSRYSWNRWLDSSYTLSRELSINYGQEITLIEQLVTDGSNGEDEKKGHNYQNQNPTRLLFVPGTINVGDKNIFCHTITYEFPLPEFGDNNNTQSVTTKIEVHYPERQIGDNEIISLRLFGNFQKWNKEQDGETQVKITPGKNNNWAIIDENTQCLKTGDNAVLYSNILSPTYSNKKYSGIYIKHKRCDEMIVDINPCTIPLVVGSVQKYRKQLEQADVTLSGKKIAISVSSHYQRLDKSEAIVLDNSEIKLNHDKKIFGQAQRQVDFLSQSVEIGSSQVNIKSGKTQINSLVNISFPTPKFPTPNIPSPPGVAGLTSGKVGGASNTSEGSGSDKEPVTKRNNEAPPKQVFMKGLDGKTKPLQIAPTTKIGDLKEKLGLPASTDTYFTHGGKALKDELTVADYPDIQKDSTLEIRGRLRGGGNLNNKVINPNSPIFSLMNDKTIEPMVRKDKKGEYENLIHQLPNSVDNLDDLEKFSDVANKIFKTFDFNSGERFGMENGKPTDKIGSWANKMQQEIYKQRDSMENQQPGELEKRYGLENQFKKKFPGQDIPPELQSIDIDPKILKFTPTGGSNENDCGKFANKLFNERKNQIIKDSNQGEDILNRKDVQETNKIKISYKDDDSLPCPHHYKTSLAGSEKKPPIYTLEAHAGKPFLLGPELHKYDSIDDLEEKQNPQVEKVEPTTMKGSKDITSAAESSSRVAGTTSNHS
ncbi:MAG: ubiquitin-like protein [Rivularia sp. (in: cyanobacteria)]